MRNIFLVSFGIFVGMIISMSCSDDSPPSVDAAVNCDCPQAEPPLKQRLVRVSGTQTIGAMSIGGAATGCLPEDVVISGGCLSGITDSRHVLLSSNPSPPENPVGWLCVFSNGTAAPVVSTAYALCLKPAP